MVLHMTVTGWPFTLNGVPTVASHRHWVTPDYHLYALLLCTTETGQLLITKQYDLLIHTTVRIHHQQNDLTLHTPDTG